MTRLARKAAARTPQREQLAAAIAARAAATNQLEKLERAASRADVLRAEARDRVLNAQAALEDAKTNGGRDIADRLLAGGDVREASPIMKAERAVMAAEEDEQRAQQTRNLLRLEHDNAVRDLKYAQRAVESAAAAVVKAEAPAATLLREAQGLQTKLIDARLKLRWLHRRDLLNGDLAVRVRTFLFDNRCLPACIGQTEFSDFDRHATSVELRDAFAVLGDDADAPLPFEFRKAP